MGSQHGPAGTYVRSTYPDAEQWEDAMDVSQQTRAPKIILCGTCDEVIQKGLVAIFCNICSKRFHLACQDVTDETYVRLIGLDDDRSLWSCQECTLISDSMLSVFRKHTGLTKTKAPDMHTVMLKAIRDHDLACVRDMLVANGVPRTEGTPPLLYVAVKEGQKDILELLLTHGANVNSVGSHATSPLRAAAELGHADLVDILVKRGANIEAPKDDISPLCAAVSSKETEIVEYLIAAGADVNRKGSKVGHALPLLRAAEHGEVEVLNLLLKADCDLRSTGKGRKTALHVAAEEGHVRAVERLLTCGVNVDAVDTSGYTPLMRATSKGHAEVVRQLCIHGSALNLMTGPAEAPTPCMLAARYGHVGALQILIGFGVDVNLQTEPELENVVHVVVKACCHRALIDGRRRSRKETVPVNREIEVLDLLVQAGVDINATTEDGRTPLHHCVTEGCPALVEYLIKAGAHTLTENVSLQTPLWTSCLNVCRPITQLLIQHCPLDIQYHINLNAGGPGGLMQHLGNSTEHLPLMQLLVEGGYMCPWEEGDLLRAIWQDTPELVQFVDDNLLAPWPLQRICCRNIRLLLRINVENKLYRMPIPQRIRDIILLKQIFIPR